MFYILLSIFIVFLSFHLFKKTSGVMSITQLNIISFNYYYQLIIQSFIGVNIVILGIDQHYLLSRITSFSVKQSAYFSVVLVLLLLPLSMLFISFIFKFDAKKEWDFYTQKDVQSIITKDDKAVFLTMILFTLISMLSIIYTFITIGTIPLFEMFFGSEVNVNRLRILASREFGGIVYIRNIFGLIMTPILSYIAYVYRLKTKERYWKNLSSILILLSILILTYSGAKAPVLLYILSFIFLRVLVYGKVHIKKIITTTIVTLIILLSFYVIVFDFDSDFLDINSGPLGRILLGQVTSLYFHFLYFPDIIDYLGIRGLPSFIAELYGLDAIRSSRVIMEEVNPRGVDLGTAGVMNTLFIAEIYAAFGWIGMLFSIVFVGFYLQLIYIFMLRLPKNPIFIALFTYLTYNIPITGGFFDFIYNPGLLATVIILILFYLITKINNKLLIFKKGE